MDDNVEQLSLFDEEQEKDFDSFDDNGVEAKVRLGDLWQLGNHRLLCADSTIKENIETLTGGASIDMVFTDPPYGYEYQSHQRHDKFNILKNDDKILNFFPHLKSIIKGFVLICTTWKTLDKWLPLFLKYYDLTNMIIWFKGGGGMGDLNKTFATDYEIILVSNNGQNIQGKRIGSVWKQKCDSPSSYLHPTQKPVGLILTAINHTTKENNNVMDIFGGSGSTLIACEIAKRNCYTMELDPHYCDVIISRWEKITGKEAKLIKRDDIN